MGMAGAGCGPTHQVCISSWLRIYVMWGARTYVQACASNVALVLHAPSSRSDRSRKYVYHPCIHVINFAMSASFTAVDLAAIEHPSMQQAQ